jgi:hypothetical protein
MAPLVLLSSRLGLLWSLGKSPSRPLQASLTLSTSASCHFGPRDSIAYAAVASVQLASPATPGEVHAVWMRVRVRDPPSPSTQQSFRPPGSQATSLPKMEFWSDAWPSEGMGMHVVDMGKVRMRVGCRGRGELSSARCCFGYRVRRYGATREQLSRCPVEFHWGSLVLTHGVSPLVRSRVSKQQGNSDEDDYPYQVCI